MGPVRTQKPRQLLPSAVAMLAAAAFACCLLPVVTMLVGCFFKNFSPSLAHVSAAFSDPTRTITLATNTIIVTGLTVLCALLLGMPAGYICFRTSVPGRRLFIIAAVIAACIPIHVTATCWMSIFGADIWRHSILGAAWIGGIAFTPLTLLICGCGFALVDRTTEEMASLDLNPLQILRFIVLPRSAWAIAVSAIVVGLLSLWEVTITDILMIRTFAEESLTQFQLGAGPWQAAAISLPVIPFLLLLAVILHRLLSRYQGNSAITALTRPLLHDPRGYKIPLCLLLTAITTVFFIVPFFALAIRVGHPSVLITVLQSCNREFLSTLRIIPLSAIFTLLLAIPLAWTITFATRWRYVVLLGLFLLLAVPAPVIGIGLIQIFNRHGALGAIYDSSAILILAYIIRSLPFAVLFTIPALLSVPKDTLDSISLAGGTSITRFIHGILPRGKHLLCASWLLLIAFSLSETGATFLVVPPSQQTITIRFFTLIHYGVYPDAAAICLILLATVAITTTAAMLTARLCWRS